MNSNKPPKTEERAEWFVVDDPEAEDEQPSALASFAPAEPDPGMVLPRRPVPPVNNVSMHISRRQPAAPSIKQVPVEEVAKDVTVPHPAPHPSVRAAIDASPPELNTPAWSVDHALVSEAVSKPLVRDEHGPADIEPDPSKVVRWWERPGVDVAPPEGEESAVPEHDAHFSALAPATWRIAPVGFRQSDLIRIGSPGATVPFAHVGLIVIARTPQRIRLGQITPVKEARSIIGRGKVACFVDDPMVADFHAVIVFRRVEGTSGFYLYSTPSAPTYVNRQLPEMGLRLNSGDRIALGNSELVFFEVDLNREDGQ